MDTNGGQPPTLSHFLEYYLSTETRDNLGGSCAMTASASEIGRQDENVSASFTDGFDKVAKAIEAVEEPNALGPSTRERALAITAALIGGVAVARGVAKANPALSEEVLQALKNVLGTVGEGATPEVVREGKRSSKPARTLSSRRPGESHR